MIVRLWKRLSGYVHSARSGYWSVGETSSSPDVDGPKALELWMTSPDHRHNTAPGA